MLLYIHYSILAVRFSVYLREALAGRQTEFKRGDEDKWQNYGNTNVHAVGEP